MDLIVIAAFHYKHAKGRQRECVNVNTLKIWQCIQISINDGVFG